MNPDAFGKRAVSGSVAVVLAILVLFGARGAVAETIRISGTGGAIGAMRILAESFRGTNPGTRFEILQPMGSGGGIRAVAAGRLDIGVSARSLSAGERGRGIVATKYATTPFVFGVNGSLKMTGLTLGGIAAIYAGKRDWENGRRIRPVLRPAEDSDYLVLRRMSPAMDAAVDIALGREGMIVATTDHDAADAIERIPGAFGGTTLALVLSEKRDFRILALDGVVPSLRTMIDRSYPYSKAFFLVVKKDPSVSVRRFIAFVRSPAGAAILERYGQAPARDDGAPP